MAHFAELNNDDIVLRVIVVSNDDIMKNGVEDENTGIAFCQKLFGNDTRWVQTSYNNSFRIRYAGKGYFFDRTKNVFIRPKPYPSWVLDNSSYDWVAPIPYPNDGNFYTWDETNLTWVRTTVNYNRAF